MAAPFAETGGVVGAKWLLPLANGVVVVVVVPVVVAWPGDLRGGVFKPAQIPPPRQGRRDKRGRGRRRVTASPRRRWRPRGRGVTAKGMGGHIRGESPPPRKLPAGAGVVASAGRPPATLLSSLGDGWWDRGRTRKEHGKKNLDLFFNAGLEWYISKDVQFIDLQVKRQSNPFITRKL